MISSSAGQDTHDSGLFKTHISPHKAQISSVVGGSLSTITFGKNKSVTRRYGGGTRKEVRGLSNSSRLRFLREMASINFSRIKGRVLFVTLTYPKNKRSTDPKVLKRNLQKLKQRLERKYGKAPAFWRLELQSKDGNINPHFHLLLILDQRISNKVLANFRVFVANSWYEVCGKSCDDHLLAGTQVKRVRSRRDWDRLTRYVGKKEKLHGETLVTGRVWGIWSKKLLPIEHEFVKINLKDAFKIRRWMWRLAGKKRGIGHLLQQHVFIRYENMNRLLNYLNEQEDRSVYVPGADDHTLQYSSLSLAA